MASTQALSEVDRMVAVANQGSYLQSDPAAVEHNGNPEGPTDGLCGGEAYLILENQTPSTKAIATGGGFEVVTSHREADEEDDVTADPWSFAETAADDSSSASGCDSEEGETTDSCSSVSAGNIPEAALGGTPASLFGAQCSKFTTKHESLPVPKASDRIAHLENAIDHQSNAASALVSLTKGFRNTPDAASFPFLDLPREIRDLVYHQFFPRAKVIQLTECLATVAPEGQGATTYKVQTDGINLMCSCSQVWDETTTMLNGTNTFLLTPGRISYPLVVGRFPHYNSNFWLHVMSDETKVMVKKLQVSFEAPYHALNYFQVAKGLAAFEEIEIHVGLPTEKYRGQEVEQLKVLCAAVVKARSKARSIVWEDGGDGDVRAVLEGLGVGQCSA